MMSWGNPEIVKPDIEFVFLNGPLYKRILAKKYAYKRKVLGYFYLSVFYIFINVLF